MSSEPLPTADTRSETTNHTAQDGEALSREQRRSRRKRSVRPRTISVKRINRGPLERSQPLSAEALGPRPATRAECASVARPCPFISCKHNLYLDVSGRTGSIKLNFPDLEVWEMSRSCALDIAESGGCTLETVGEIMNLTRERVRQLEVSALGKLQALDDMFELRDPSGSPAHG